MEARAVEERIERALPGATVEVRDTTGTGDHFEALVVSEAFEGKTMIQQHQLVYAPLSDVLKSGELHALSLKTYSKTQWAKVNGGAR